MTDRISYSLPSLIPPPPSTIIEVSYPVERGSIGLRGSIEPLSWDHTAAPDEKDGDRNVFRIPLQPGEVLELKLVRNDEEWSGGRAYAVHAGDHLFIEPYFETVQSTLCPAETIELEGQALQIEVCLPPSYNEQSRKHYPVLYALDGQSLWTSSTDPFGIWNLDDTLNELYDLGAIDEIIVVGIHTSERRMERLTHVRHEGIGGGEGPHLLRGIVDGLIPYVNKKFRTRPEREHTGVMGSSLGGLFAFVAAWTRPDVFGKAACLSSSFWWGNRHAVRLVQSGSCPVPKPFLYLDSGAARNAFDRDPNARDGFHHMRAMFRALINHCYTPGIDVHRLTFTGHDHSAASWGARVAIPLQLLFPLHVRPASAESLATAAEVAAP